MLLGLELCEAKKRLEAQGRTFEVTEYRSRVPYENADSQRVVRAVERGDGLLSLTVCGFVTKLNV